MNRQPRVGDDGKLKQSLLKVGGETFWCDCGCNVFNQPDINELSRYACNSCEAEYVTQLRGNDDGE